MRVIRLDTKEQFAQLKQNDLVLVEWKEGAFEAKKGHPITCNHIYGIYNGNELILNKRTNSYFNIDMYLDGLSNAKEAYMITQDSES